MTDDQSHSHSPARGLATVAFLKARYDAGKDHLEMFQPFVDDAIRRHETDDIELDDIRDSIRISTGLRFPAPILKTLLQRAAKKKLLTRDGGRYFRAQDQSEDPEFSAAMAELGRTHVRLGARLRGFAADRGQVLRSDEDALAALTRFLDANQIGIVLGQPLTAHTPVDTLRANQILAAFVSEIIAEGGRDSDVLGTIVEGVIVQNALLLRDIPSIRNDLYRLTIFFDTDVLLNVLGYAGPTEQRAATESVRLIHQAGGRLKAFERTVNEVDGVLRALEMKLASSRGIKTLRPGAVTDHFLSIRARPSDVRQERALLRKNLEALGFRTEEFPRHITRYTEDEQALAAFLKAPNRTIESDADRIWHDVRAITSILTLRRGARPTKLTRAKYVFASGSGHTLASAARWWNRDSGLHGLPPIVHFRAVANAAWFLRRPASASDVPMHDLVAVCAAILRPSARLWANFVRHLEQFVASGVLSDDESVAVLASELTEPSLADYEHEEDLEASTVLEIVERVKREHEARLRPKLDESRQKQEESERIATLAQAQLSSLRTDLENRADRLATAVARTVYVLLCLALTVGAVLTLPTAGSAPPRADVVANLAWWAVVGLFFTLSLLDFFSPRFHLSSIPRRLRGWLAGRLRRVFLPEAEDGD